MVCSQTAVINYFLERKITNKFLEMHPLLTQRLDVPGCHHAPPHALLHLDPEREAELLGTVKPPVVVPAEVDEPAVLALRVAVGSRAQKTRPVVNPSSLV